MVSVCCDKNCSKREGIYGCVYHDRYRYCEDCRTCAEKLMKKYPAKRATGFNADQAIGGDV